MARGSASFKTGQKDVSTTAVLIVPARPGRITVVISPMASVNCYFGEAGVTKDTGLFTQGGSPATIDTAAEIWGLADAASRVSYIEYF